MCRVRSGKLLQRWQNQEWMHVICDREKLGIWVSLQDRWAGHARIGSRAEPDCLPCLVTRTVSWGICMPEEGLYFTGKVGEAYCVRICPWWNMKKSWVQGTRWFKDFESGKLGNLVPLIDVGIRRESLFLSLSGNSLPLLGNFSNGVLDCFMSSYVTGVAIKWKEIMHPDQQIFSAEEKLVN